MPQMDIRSDFETIRYEEGDDGVAVVTLDRPEVHNAFNSLMQRELHEVWHTLRRRDSVRVIVLTGAGDKAFCTGIDRMEQMGGKSDHTTDPFVVGSGGTTPFMFNDPGDNLGPKSCDLWKPVIGAINGIACGGACYMMGECEFLIAAEHATFFDPHTTYGMAAGFEPVHMAGIMPFGEIMRLALVGAHERWSAQRMYQIGAVSEVVPGEQLLPRAKEVAATIASQPRLAVEATLRSLWKTREVPQREAVRLAYAFVALGTNWESIEEGQKFFESGKRIDWKLR